MPPRPKVAIIGAGFGGLFAARALRNKPVDLLLMDKDNYHLFWPLLYQVAAAELEPEEICYPVRTILHRQKNASFALDEISEIDFQAKTLQGKDQSYHYDYLIITTGSVTNFYGVSGAEEHSFPLKGIRDGTRLRNQVLSCFERASLERDPERRKSLLTFAIAGGGPTGVEYAGALSELINHPLARDFPHLDMREARVVILEAKEALLPGLISCCGDYVKRRLEQMGVEVRLGAAVDEVTRTEVHLKDGTSIPTDTVVWTTGVQGDPNARVWGLPSARGGRVPVEPTLQTSDHPEVYIAGDLAYFEQDGHPLPQVAPVAIQQGEHAVKNILRQIEGRELLPFHYHNRGTMAVIGRNAAVAEIGGRGFTGFPAWLLWLGVHLFNLIGFRNRLLVMINWALDYITYQRNVRLILR